MAVARDLEGDRPLGLPRPLASLLTAGLITGGMVTQFGLRGLSGLAGLPAAYLGSGLAGAVVKLAAPALDRGPFSRILLSGLAAIPGCVLFSIGLDLALGWESLPGAVSFGLEMAALIGPIIAWRVFGDVPYHRRAT